jgi:multifunctional beta-oxidation protein
VAVVTGAGNGLGRAYAEYLVRLGAKVVVNDISSTPCKKKNQVIYAADRVVEAFGEENAVANHDSVQEGHKIIDIAIKKCMFYSNASSVLLVLIDVSKGEE